MNEIQTYLDSVPIVKKVFFLKLRQTIQDNIPFGFEERFIYSMIGYVIPHTIYPAGYHCDPKLPLTFINIANQKNFIAIYHLGLYMKPDLLNWFIEEFPKYSKTKLDIGKSCIRFKKVNEIPFDLIAELIKKMSVESYLEAYKSNLKPK